MVEREPFWRRGAIAYGLLVVAVAVGFWRIQILTDDNHRLAVQNREFSHITRDQQDNIQILLKRALEAQIVFCASQTATRKSVRASVQYLNDVRAGLRIRRPGISEGDTLAEIEREQAYLKTLDALNCPKTPA